MQVYRFITNNDTSDFCMRVTEALSKGWSLHGDPQYAFDQRLGVMRCAQAVIKETDVSYSPDLKLGEL